ncbi:MAG TPA: hypothetical protein PLI97_12820, partial [Fluviicola sp.]|nr:hypothetical protein [Fluviicola sp.]
MKKRLLFYAFLLFISNSYGQCSADAGLDSSVCIGATIALGGTPAGTGAAPLTYSWTPSTGLSCTNCP